MSAIGEKINQQMVAEPDHAGQRLDKVAAELFDEFSRSELTRWIIAGELKVDGEICKPKLKLHGGEILVLTTSREPRQAWQTAQAMDLDICFEDDDLMIVNKPVGLVVHPGAGNADGTLVNGLLSHDESLSLLPRGGIVHRLDKDTSGVMVVAKTSLAHTRLTQMISERLIHRRYVGLAEGVMVSGQNVDAPIGRHPTIRTKQAVSDTGKPAYTEFRVKQRFRAHTLVDAKLGTGRTHQIRVHLQSIGYPLVGDRRYGARGVLPSAAAPELIDALRAFSRQALHAASLEFTHPISDRPIQVTAELPADMQALHDLLVTDAK